MHSVRSQSVTRVASFSAAHRLPLHSGLCQHVHGHNYDVEVTVTVDSVRSSEGMIIDFGYLDQIIDTVIINKYDHSFIRYSGDNAVLVGSNHICVLDVMPTAENMSRIFAVEIMSAVRFQCAETVRSVRVAVWENKKSKAECEVVCED